MTFWLKVSRKAGIGYLGVDGVVKADVKSSVKDGIIFGADKKGLYSALIAEFGGVVATFVRVLVEKNEVKFSEYYLDL